MKLYEYEGKKLFRHYGIPTPRGCMVTCPEGAAEAHGAVGLPAVVKSQVLSGGRGKAGGIRFAGTPEELKETIASLLSGRICGEKVDRLLVEEKIEIKKEFYLGITIDPAKGLPVIIASDHGGMDVEYAAQHTGGIHKYYIDPLDQPGLIKLIDFLRKTGMDSQVLWSTAEILVKLVRLFFDYDALTVEINPLIMDNRGNLIAGDSKVVIDDSSLFRLSEKLIEREEKPGNELEAEARAAGLAYVDMEGGDIGLIAGGAGLGMASMDMISANGGMPANFLDLGGGGTSEKMSAALRIVLKKPGIRGVLVNVYGGINNCREMAKGIVKVFDKDNPKQAIVVKMRGHSQDEGWALLEKKNIPVVKRGSTEDAVRLLLNEMANRR
ncbi:MAG: ATP-grasp domain-containing protein [Bacillota bacterium]